MVVAQDEQGSDWILGSPSTFQQNAKQKADQLAELVIRKQRDYGTGNILKSPIDPRLAVLVRLNDKLQRAVNLIQNNNEAQNESLTDTFNDVMGYGMILAMLEDNTFELPLERE